MKILIKRAQLITIILGHCFVLTAYCQGIKNTSVSPKQFPAYNNYTNDFENILDKQEEDKLNALIAEIEAKTKLEFAVVTLSSKMLGKMGIQKYSLELAKKWGVGKKELNNGILIALSKENRNIYIQIGTGIESIYTNNQVKAVIDQTMKPAFIVNRFYEGIFGGIIRINEELKPNLTKIPIS
jgi:uncharacterized protein